MKYKTVEEMNDGDMVAGVVYAAAAEQRIELAWFKNGLTEHLGSIPTVIGYIVKEVNDAKTA